MAHTLRESWLRSAIPLLLAFIEDAGHKVKLKEERIKVTCGFPSKSALCKRKQRIGECWSDSASKGKVFEIFISPVLDDESRVLDVLLHELIHAVAGLECGHKGAFKRIAVDVGLQGKMTATVAGDDLKRRIASIRPVLGAYPHRQLLPHSNAPKKQAARLLKAECPGCGYCVRVTRKWVDVGLPICPACDVPFACPDAWDDEGGQE